MSSLPPGVVSVDDYEALARTRMDEGTWAYISGGAADERTLAWNRDAFDRLKLRGRVLTDFSHAHTRLSLLGVPLEYPILLAPVALQRLAHPDGECAAAQAAGAMRTIMTVSTEASCPLESIVQSASGGALWFQLYIQRDRGLTRDLAQRAEAAGYRALVLTVDAPVSGPRYRQQRAGFRPPAGVEAVNLRGAEPLDAPPPSLVDSPLFGGFLAKSETWADVEWLQAQTKLPLVLKGISSADDAARAVDGGVDAIAVSNHGGRTLDTLPASIDLLPPIAERLAGRVPLLVDGGIRRGTDVAVALALGADAVLAGRPCVWGLAAGGQVGAERALAILGEELRLALALLGCPSASALDRSCVRRRWRG